VDIEALPDVLPERTHMAKELMTPSVFGQHVARIAAQLTEATSLGELQ
jgi:hypothetical protein